MFEASIDVDPERGTADSGDLQADLCELFVAIAEAAADRQTAVALVVGRDPGWRRLPPALWFWAGRVLSRCRLRMTAKRSWASDTAM